MYKIDNVKYTKFCQSSQEVKRLRKEITFDILKGNMINSGCSKEEIKIFEEIYNDLYEIMIPFFKLGYINDISAIRKIYDKVKFSDFLITKVIKLEYKEEKRIYIINEPIILKMFNM